MIKTLVSVNADLASSIAIRFAAQLAELLEMGLQTIHIKEPDPETQAPGTGWVRKTWEKALWESGKDEVGRILSAERVNCPVLGPPKVAVGIREDEILRELHSGDYDLFMEGVLPEFKLSSFRKLLRSKLFKYMPCPTILVKNLSKLEKIDLVVSGGMSFKRVIPAFCKIFSESRVGLDLIDWHRQDTTKMAIHETAMPGGKIQEVKDMLVAQGCSPGKILVAEGTPSQLAERLRYSGLVACGVRREAGKKDPFVDFLSRVPAPVLLCWE